MGRGELGRKKKLLLSLMNYLLSQAVNLLFLKIYQEDINSELKGAIKFKTY